MSIETLPLFPLHTVLLPGGTVDLRVFEARYLDLVRECGRTGRTFGVCLILDGPESGGVASPAAVGTEARIEDFDLASDGLLMLRLRGARRFRARRMRVRDNGLQIAEIDWCDSDPEEPVRPEHAALVDVVRRLLERAGDPDAGAPGRQFNDAAWIGWRLAERLPLSDATRQSLLQLDDPHARLQRLLSLID
ncbi:LON peptidase substrate-binding domain-containing protein [Cognatilysobacter bugurensis]|uniref:ATP-dependent protease n=1 Tax=Cognatilysobacter bugurensis TaxID=543356 RepID=A0A918W8J5_9GAMM|nr:LON peptidase substrate-binding domain-containing protein [Lysobacter bugurensis]GHA81105.1 ATP-dependent protease [Lysobacter bugurensis]